MADKALEKANNEILKAVRGEGGWKYHYNKLEVDVHFNEVKVPSGNVMKFTKGVGILPVSPVVATELALDFEFMNSWDKQFDVGHVIQDLTSEKQERFYTYQRFHAPWPVSKRDFCSVVGVYRDKGGRFRVTATSHHHTQAPKPTSTVRAELFYGGWVFEPLYEGEDIKTKIDPNTMPKPPIVPNKCRGYYVTAMDPKGTLPIWLVNKVAEDTPMCLANMNRFIREKPRKLELVISRSKERLRKLQTIKTHQEARMKESAQDSVEDQIIQEVSVSAPVNDTRSSSLGSADESIDRPHNIMLTRSTGVILGLCGIGCGLYMRRAKVEHQQDIMLLSLALIFLSLMIITPNLPKSVATVAFNVLGALAATALTPPSARNALGGDGGVMEEVRDYVGLDEMGVVLGTYVCVVSFLGFILWILGINKTKSSTQATLARPKGKTTQAEIPDEKNSASSAGGARVRSRSQPPGIRKYASLGKKLSDVYLTTDGARKEFKDSKAWKSPILKGESDKKSHARRLNVRVIGSKVTGMWGRAHVRYMVVVRKGNHMFRVQRRYREFDYLHQALCSQFGENKVVGCGFPPKTLFPDTTQALQDRRKKELNTYLNNLATHNEIWHSKTLYRFFLPNMKLRGNSAV
mmetsp:Transcript_10821/g.16113  ORF Transcript_10821/g.16113 Transcript_10821/m.16113 type:complete len:633 (+) Transcript_10821:70-1968(+)